MYINTNEPHIFVECKTRKGLLLDHSKKVEEMLNWRGAVDRKQDEGNKKLNEATFLINQVQSAMNMLIGMNKVLALKL
jgi:hypothetical protein